MRISLALFVLSLAGAVAGAWLIGQWAVGCVVLAYSVVIGVYALLRDVPEPAAAPGSSHDSVLDMARRAS